MTDRDAVLTQLAEFALALDTRNWDAVRMIVSPDAHCYGQDGVENILAVLQHHLGGVGPTQHLLGNHRVAIDGTRGRSLSYVRVYHAGAGAKEGSFFECMGEYDDAWEWSDGRWRLVAREFTTHLMLGDITVLRPGPPDTAKRRASTWCLES